MSNKDIDSDGRDATKILQNWSEAEAAAHIGISRLTLLRNRQQGEISYFRVGTRVVYSDEHIREFLTRCEQRDVPVKGVRICS